MSGNMSRNKGKRGEREIITLLQPLIDQVCAACNVDAPMLKRNTLQSDGGGFDIVGLNWIALEVKYHETFQVEKWWEQCVRQAGPEQMPVLVYRRNGMRTWHVRMFGFVGEPSCGHTVPVVVTWEDFLKWFRTRLTEEVCNER